MTKHIRVLILSTVFVCIVVILIGCFIVIRSNHTRNGNTLPGALEIYPAVMVEDKVYEWHRGKAILEKLPDNSAYYGEINHIKNDYPNQNCEFVSNFSVSGQIYTVPNDTNKIYLCITTDWLSNSVVIFDIQQ
ncbi:hypothetical protein QMP28_06115 [[Clostridium] symbiosum]|uniref:hypothetical protein n=1 Tax=Clostridium symbiosum TaxID=1512 RepID=UPI003312FD18